MSGLINHYNIEIKTIVHHDNDVCIQVFLSHTIITRILKGQEWVRVCTHVFFFFFFYMPIKIYNTDLLVTLLTEYLTTLQGRCHWVQNAMTTPWHHKKLRRFTYELQKKKFKT